MTPHMELSDLSANYLNLPENYNSDVLTDVDSDSDDGVICSICMSVRFEFILGHERSLYTTPCGHYYHRECINRWCMTNNNCPVCRTPNIMGVNASSNNNNNNNNISNNNNLNLNSHDIDVSDFRNISRTSNDVYISANINNDASNYNDHDNTGVIIQSNVDIDNIDFDNISIETIVSYMMSVDHNQRMSLFNRLRYTNIDFTDIVYYMRSININNIYTDAIHNIQNIQNIHRASGLIST